MGLRAPDEVDGIKQKPMEGVSLVYTFDKPDAPTTHKTSISKWGACRDATVRLDQRRPNPPVRQPADPENRKENNSAEYCSQMGSGRPTSWTENLVKAAETDPEEQRC
jgi:hypothetical protein